MRKEFKERLDEAIQLFEDWRIESESFDMDQFAAAHPISDDIVDPLQQYVQEVRECEERFALLGRNTGHIQSARTGAKYRDRDSALSYCEISRVGATGEATVAPTLDDATLPKLNVGDIVNERYVLRDELGRGGNGIVFLAHDQRLGRDVALKVQRRHEHPELRDALAREAKMAASLRHEGIAGVYDFGTHADLPYTTFEFVDGETLREGIVLRPRWSAADVAFIISELADALDYAHAQGVVHRDLKPENICLGIDGSPKILDFGVARNLHMHTDEKTFRGTVAYAAPEQAACRAIDARTDQYALGLIAFELLCGRRPFQGKSVLDLLRQHEHEPAPRIHELVPNLPAAVGDAVMRTLKKDPNHRFATCREFAAALIPSDATIPSDVGHSIHISLEAGESLIARQLARKLERSGFSTWYYQRNALPGIPLGRQVRSSLQTARAAVLLISRDSLTSEEFNREVVAASELGKPFLPILINMSLEEFGSHQPIWRPVLGTAAVIELDRTNAANTHTRILAAIEQLGISPDQPITALPPNQMVTTAQPWATDANQIDISELDKVVFRNEFVDSFLNRRNQYFISATKGLGKTLLLTFKRRLLTEGQDQLSLVFIPTGKPFLDFMSEMKMLSERNESPLRDLSTCKRLWGTALRISVLSHHPGLLEDEQKFELEPFPRRIQRWLKGAKVEPSVAFKELTGLRIGDFNQLIDHTEIFLDQQIRQVQSSTLVFIDKVDQAVRRLSHDAWINVQAGLIEAAWDLMSANSHIKVFASIRQEAFANYESDIKSNLFGATTLLRYNDKDLRSIMDRLTDCYEEASSFKEFVGVNVIKHARRAFPEDSFEFVRRYTVGRPRDFVAVASELSTAASTLDERRYCDLVRKTSATGLVANIFDEAAVFLDCLQDRDNRMRFLSQLKVNILPRDMAVAISARFNGLPEDSLKHFGEEAPELFHPFRDLFLTGLLGVINRSDQDVETQRFRQPDDMLTDSASDLPQSTHYLLHPALSEYIKHHRQSAEFRIVQHVLVGEHAAWHPFDSIICSIEAEVAAINDVALRKEIHAILGQARTILLSSKERLLRVELESSKSWKRVINQLTGTRNEDVLLWFDELMA